MSPYLAAIASQSSSDQALTNLTLALVIVTGVMAVATVWLGIQTWRSVREATKSVEEARRLADATERQITLVENELRLVERQVSAMERQLALQERAEDVARRRAFPILEAEATELAEQEVKGQVHYLSGKDAAEDIEVHIWFRSHHYRAQIGTLLPTPGKAGFTAIRQGDLDPAEASVPGWALTRGSRVDAVSWRSGAQGEWWAQRYDAEGRRVGMPDHGDWLKPGIQTPGRFA
jgi:hypothetical protein